MAESGNAIQIQKDRINELLVDVLDNIMRFLPIKDAARTAVLSHAWRDTWFNLTQLNFDDSHFFYHMMKKYFDDWKIAGLHIIHKILRQHSGSILKFVFSLWDPFTDIRSWSFDFHEWFLCLTRKGVEEISLSFNVKDEHYRLPNCILFCPTLKSVYVHGVYFEPIIDAHCSILPNVTSLCF